MKGVIGAALSLLPTAIRLADRRIVLLFAFAALNSLYFRLIFGSVGEIATCCDASRYLRESDKLFSEGLLFQDAYIGYRSYFNYGFTGVLRLIGSLAGGTQADSFVFGALFIFAVSGVGLILTLGHKKGFTSIFAALFLNPITLSYVVYPLQEAQMAILLGAGTVAIWVALRERWNRSALIALLVFAALAWMVKGSLIAISIPVAGLAIFIAVCTKGSWLPFLGGTFLALVIIAPQSYIAWQKFGTLYPYPDHTVMAKQVVWGHSAWRYETARSEGKWQGVWMRTPFLPIKSKEEYVSRLKTAPFEIVSLWIGHVVGAFDYSQLKVYIVEARSSLFSPFNVVVGAVLYLGLAGWVGVLSGRQYSRSDFFLDSIMLGATAALPLLAVETRFSLLPTMILTFRAVEWLALVRANGNYGREAFFALLFGLMFSLTIALMNGQS